MIIELNWMTILSGLLTINYIGSLFATRIVYKSMSTYTKDPAELIGNKIIGGLLWIISPLWYPLYLVGKLSSVGNKKE